MSLNRDVHPINQPKGTYRYALNATVETRDGDLLFYSKERGTKELFTLNKTVIGAGSIGGDRLIIFSTDDVNSEIGLWDGTRYSIVSDLSCLNFKKTNPIDFVYRVREGCKDVIYFTDGLNPVRYIDLSEVPTCESLSLFKGFTIPEISYRVLSGGQLQKGAYQFALRYIDQNDNATAWFVDTKPVYIADGNSYSTLEGGTGQTNKQIEINTSSLDQTFSFYQIAVNEYTSGSGVLSRTLLSPKIAITQTSFRFNGRNEGFTETVIEALNQGSIGIETAKHIEQIENRLILGNVTEKQIDWCGFQKVVNDIKVRYETQAVPKYSDESYPLSLMADEVYAFAIAFRFKDGYLSPFFNIPAEAPELTDTRLYTVVPSNPVGNQVSLSNVTHLGLSVGDTVPRWKIENTARNGRMGYYEVSQTYPQTLDCNGEPVWGSLAGQPIRHFKAPDRTIVPLHDEDNVYTISVVLEGVTFPHDDIIGYELAYANGETIQDKGFAFPVWEFDVNFVENDFFFGDALHEDTLALEAGARIRKSPKKAALITPKFLFQNETLNPDYIRQEGFSIQVGDYRQDSFVAQPSLTDTDTTELKFKFTYYDFNSGFTASSASREIVDVFRFSEGQSRDAGVGTIFNRSLSNSFLQVNLVSDYDTTNFNYISLKNNVEVLTNLDSIQYTLFSGGDVFITPFTYENLLREQYKRGTFNNLRSIELDGSLLTNLWVESKVNTFLRTRGDEYCQQFFRPESDYDPLTNTGANYLYDKYAPGTEDVENYYGGVCQQYLDLNDDYNVTNRLRTYLTLPSNFDCCSPCLGVYKTRVYYSSQSFQEEKADFYRVFLPNNYRDIEGETGEITNIFRYQENLYIQTQDALWMLPSNVQERVSEEGIVSFLGAGEFFGLPPRRVVDSDVGAGGCVDKYTLIKTPQGVFYLDRENGEPYFQFKEVNEGMRVWFEENSTSTLRQLIKDAGGDLGFIGAWAAFESRHDRLFLCIKDYEPIKWGGLTTEPIKKPDHVYFDNDTKKFYVNGLEVSLNSKYFCNKSWTLSLSLLTGSWISFHSFTPDWITFTKNQVISFYGGKAWGHNQGEYGSYYGGSYPFVIEPVEVSPVTKIWDSIKIYATDRFTQAVIYTSKQSTGLLTLTEPETNINYMLLRVKDQSSQISIVKEDENYYINKFYDQISGSITQDGCTDFRLTDKNFTTITQRNWFERTPIEDKFVIYRLIHNLDSKLTFIFSETKNTDSEK